VVVDGGDSVRADDRKAMARLREDIGMVFQDYTLFPHMTVMANMILAPVKVKKQSKLTPRPMRWHCWTVSDCGTRQRAIRANCRAASNSVWQSSAHWR
jgi:ABC-type histidine transport system ATPase subunit